MIFQPLKNKLKTVYYVDGHIVEHLPNDKLQTWTYDALVDKTYNAEYAFLYTEGKSCEEVAGNLKSEYSEAKQKLQSHLRALKTCKLNLNVLPWWQHVPLDVIKTYCDIKNKITAKVFTDFKRPEYYDLLLSTQRMLQDIEDRTPALAQPAMYNLFGTVTGRLSTKPGSLPILTMKKSDRNTILPANTAFMSFDYNAIEPRIFAAYCGIEQPKRDFYYWVKKEIFNKQKDRNEIKLDFISWMYGQRTDEVYEKVFDKSVLLTRYYNGGTSSITNAYGRTVACLPEKALPYLISSTAAYLFYEQAVKINQFLKDKRTYIRFLIHDDIVFDYDTEEDIVKEMLDIFTNTRYGIIPVNMKIGNNLGEMKRTIVQGAEKWFIQS